MLSFFGGSFDTLCTPLMACGDEESVEETKQADPSLVNAGNSGGTTDPHGDVGCGSRKPLLKLSTMMLTQLKIGILKF